MDPALTGDASNLNGPEMIERRAFCLAVLTVPALARADAPKPGLAWNRTGLPLVFPLHIQTVPGHRYFVKLSDAEDGRAALAAHFEGGALFRVLCPPGRYTVTVYRGRDWQDEDALFGPKTEATPIIGPLDFRTSGLRTRQGWIIDLKDFAQPSLMA